MVPSTIWYSRMTHFFHFIKHLYLAVSKFITWSSLAYKTSLIHISLFPRQIHGKSNWGLTWWPVCLLINTISCTVLKLRNRQAICQRSWYPTTIILDSQFPSATAFLVTCLSMYRRMNYKYTVKHCHCEFNNSLYQLIKFCNTLLFYLIVVVMRAAPWLCILDVMGWNLSLESRYVGFVFG